MIGSRRHRHWRGRNSPAAPGAGRPRKTARDANAGAVARPSRRRSSATESRSQMLITAASRRRPCWQEPPRARQHYGRAAISAVAEELEAVLEEDVVVAGELFARGDILDRMGEVAAAEVAV